MKPEPLFVPRAKGNRVRPLTRWYRVLGIASILIVSITVLTGLALNHGDALDLSHRHPHNAVVDKLYHQSVRNLPDGFSTPRGWLTQLGAVIYLDTRALAEHDAPLVGALVLKDALLLAYSDGLVQYDTDNKMVESYGALDGLALPLTRLGTNADAAIIETAGGARRFDFRQGTTGTVAKQAMIEWATPARLPHELVASLAENYRGEGVSYERVLLDLHSGRLFGPYGEWIVDGAALCLLTLALNGTYMFFKFRRSAQRPPR